MHDDVATMRWQGLIYPLTVASKSQSAPRKGAAMRVLAEMRKRCDTLVEQAAVVAAAVAARDGGDGDGGGGGGGGCC